MEEITGFFIVEDRIMQSQPSLVTVAHKDQLWDMALQQVTSTMNAHFVNVLILIFYNLRVIVWRWI